MDRFLNQLRGDKNEPSPIIAYGSAKFSPNGKGELSAPTCFVYKSVSRRFKTELIDEYNSSQACNCHDEKCHKVCKSWKDENGKNVVREVRGLRRFSTQPVVNFSIAI